MTPLSYCPTFSDRKFATRVQPSLSNHVFCMKITTVGKQKKNNQILLQNPKRRMSRQCALESIYMYIFYRIIIVC
uniref:Uncharacterized protein n=1 Tax=Pararge aegeria TaxID=116150 RepID=S4PBL0_9NEOP